MFGFIKNLFAGIFGFLGNLFGFKKTEYFLDLDDSQGSKDAKPSQPAKAEPAKAQAQEQKAAAPGAAKAEPAKATAAKPAQKAAQPATAAQNGQAAKPAAPAKAPEPAVSGFATRYLVTASNGSRRRPGANMSSYLTMARDMKTAR